MLPELSSEAATPRPGDLESGPHVSSDPHHNTTRGVLNWYRVLVTTSTLVFGLWKTVASYNNQNIISTTLDWLGAVFLSLLFFWVSECRTLTYTRWLFERQPTSDVYQISFLVSAAIKCYVAPVLSTAPRVLTRLMRRLYKRSLFNLLHVFWQDLEDCYEMDLLILLVQLKCPTCGNSFNAYLEEVDNINILNCPLNPCTGVWCRDYIKSRTPDRLYNRPGVPARQALGRASGSQALRWPGGPQTPESEDSE